MPIGDMPILEIVLRQIAQHGFNEVTLATGYLAELLMAYCGDGSKFNIQLNYSREETPLGTAGPLSLINNLTETFLVMNGDLLNNLNYTDMLANHKKRGAIATVAGYQREVKIDLGVMHINEENWVTDYIEKPTYHFSVSTGIYLFEPEILQYIPKNERFDLPDLILRLLKEKMPVNVYPFNGYWLDIGRPDDYEIAIQQFASHREQFIKTE